MKITDVVGETQLTGTPGVTNAEDTSKLFDLFSGDQFTHIGDINSKNKVFHLASSNSDFYIVKDALNDDYVEAKYQVLDSSPKVLEFVWVDPKYRGQNLTASFVSFLQKIDGHSPLLLGNKISIDALKLVNKLAGKFDVFWYNGTSKEKYNIKTVSKYTSQDKPTEWQLMLEGYIPENKILKFTLSESLWATSIFFNTDEPDCD